jgi:hypothetical protein
MTVWASWHLRPVQGHGSRSWNEAHAAREWAAATTDRKEA